MAIIDRPKSQEEPEAPKPTSGIISRPRTKAEAAPVADEPIRHSKTVNIEKSAPSFGWLKWVLILLLLGVGATFAVQYAQQVNFKSQIETENVALEVDRLIRIDSVIDLLEKKIAQNQASLQRSEKLGDKVLVDTMRLALSQNLIDLEKHQDSYTEVLVSLSDSYQSDSEGVVAVLKQQLKSSTDGYKLGRVNTIKEALELIESVPDDKSPQTYFDEKIKQQK